MAPTLFIVPGIWEGPGAFEPLAAALRSAGHGSIFTSSLVSTGKTSKTGPGPTFEDDTAAIAADLTRVVNDAGPEGVVALLHSAGGVVGSAAMKGLTAAAREKAGKPGGVKKIIFFTAGIASEGDEHKTPPFAEIDEVAGTMTCRDAINTLFSDFTPDAAQEWMEKMQPQPAHGWDGSVTLYAGWGEVPSVYIIAEEDKVVPLVWQEQWAARVGSEVVRIKAGHMAHINRTQEVAKIVGDILQQSI